MRRIAFGGLLAAALLWAADVRAGSISFTGATAGVFNNPVGGTSTGVGTGSISFGTPPGALSFTGSAFTAPAGQVFELGSIGYYNAENANPVMGVDLGLTLNLSDGSKDPGTLTLPLTLNNTPKTGDPDQLTLKPDSEVGTFVGSDGQTYGLIVKGFGPAGCNSPTMTYSGSLTANEGQVVCTSLYGEIVAAAPPPGSTPPGGGTTPVPTVPEPATVALAAVGLVTIGLRRRNENGTTRRLPAPSGCAASGGTGRRTSACS